MDLSVNDNNHGIEIESLENIFHKYDIVSDLPDSLKSCFLVTSSTNGSAAARVGVKLYDMILFPGNELSASQQPTFTMLGKKDMAFLVHHHHHEVSYIDRTD